MPSGRFSLVTGTPATPQFISIVIKGTTVESGGETKPDFNVMHFRALSPAGGGTLATFLTTYQGLIEASLVSVKTNDYTVNAYEAQYMDDPTTAKEVLASTTGGSISTDRAASFNAAVIRKLSGLTGKSYRGSMHFGALPEAFTTKDTLNITGTTAYATLLSSFGTLLAGVTDGADLFYPIILSTLQSNLIANPSIFTGSFITSYGLNNKVGTMKRRKEKAA